MTNLEMYNNVFLEVFGVEASALSAEFNKDNVDSWDSIHQLNVITALEEEFGIMFDPEAIMDFTSYEKGKKLVINQGVNL
jgi:acyl carrier protein